MTTSAPGLRHPTTISLSEWDARAAVSFCWAVWGTLVVIAVYYLMTQVSNLPMAEDWLLVPSLAGQEQQSFGAWLWEQNNEHRVPLPKLILLSILKITGGSFKAADLVNIALLAGISAAMMIALWSARGRRARYSDAFFPVVFLNAGNWENLFWAWQMTFVLSVVFGCIPLIVLVTRRPLNTFRALLIGASLITAPLCGATGLLYVPVPAVWAACAGLRILKTRDRKSVGWILLSSAIVTVVICGLYFVGYYRPPWTGSPPTVLGVLKTSLQFMALAFGPVSRSVWLLSIPLTILVAGLSAHSMVAAIRRVHGDERTRVVGLFAFWLTTLLYALAIGYGRTHALSTNYYGYPLRYMLLAAPLLCVAYVAFDELGPTTYRRYLPPLLCGIVLVLMPLNVGHGFDWAQVFKADIHGVYADITRGMSSDEIARRYNKYLNPAKTPEELGKLVRMAQHAHIHPFSTMKTETDTQSQNRLALPSNPTFNKGEVRCRVPGAARVVLVWGINGWKSLPTQWLPPNTIVAGGLMRTTMEQDGDIFRAGVSVPSGDSLDFGFQINLQNDTDSYAIWQAGKESTHLPEPSGVLEFPFPLKVDIDGIPSISLDQSEALVNYQIRYYAPNASEVRLYWGVDGWKALPVKVRPPNTEISRGVMASPMVREGEVFVADVLIPAGSAIDYGFWISQRRGILNMERPLWDGKSEYHAVVPEAGRVAVTSTIQRPGLEWLGSIPRFASWERYVLLFVVLWLALFAACSCYPRLRVRSV